MKTYRYPYHLYWFLAIRFLFRWNHKIHKIKLFPLAKLNLFLITICLFLPMLILSITHGFQDFTIKTMKDFYAPYFLKLDYPISTSILKKNLKKTSYFEDFVMLAYQDQSLPSLVRTVKEVDTQYTSGKGSVVIKKNQIWIGETLALQFGFTQGSSLKVLTFQPDHLEPLRNHTLTVAGILHLKNATLDRTISFISPETLPSLFGWNANTINTIYTDSKQNLAPYTHHSGILTDLEATPAMEQLKNQYRLLLYLGLSSTLLCFMGMYMNIKTSLQRHVYSINILRTIGINTRYSMHIFLIQSFLLICVGVLLGCLLCWFIIPYVTQIIQYTEQFLNFFIAECQHLFPALKTRWHTVTFLPKDMFYLNTVPVRMEIKDLLWIIGAIFLEVIVVVIPSIRNFHRTYIIHSLKIEQGI